MKSSIITFFVLLSQFTHAQIAFDEAGITVDSLNTPNGQNYLVINPYQPGMAFTEERGGMPQTDDPYRSEKIALENQQWEVLVFSDWLSEKGMVSPIGFTPFGIFYSQVSFDKGVYSGKVLFSSSGKAEVVDIPYFRNKAPIQSGCLSKDGKYMILSIESNHSYGVEDLYVVERKPDGTWSKVKNLGHQLNTVFQEVTPFLAEDNRTLFFATNGRGGEGSFDLFYTVRQDESWRNWSKPVNLGPKVNTSGAETSFGYQDGSKWAYYVSSQDSDGYGDVMRVRFKEEIEEDTSKVVVSQTSFEPKDSIKVDLDKDMITFEVVDANSGIPIQAELVAPLGKWSSENGIFKLSSGDMFSLGMDSNSEVEFKSPGHLSKLVMIGERLQTGKNTITLSSVAKGNVITLDHVLFHRGTANMVDGSEKELNLVVEVMNDNPDIKILLKGHTDNTGDPVKNVQLSEARVKAVKAYIINQGISPYRVSGKGYGGNQPLYSNETEETRKLNRRVEFEVVED